MPHKLLLADDSVTIQRVIELTFADEDVQVLTAGDGEQAIQRVQADRPDVVLADIGMPKRSGYDVAAFIKNNPELSHIPVLLLTGAFEPVDEGRAQAAGCDGVLVKPFDPQHVIARVRELLQARREQVASRAAATPHGSDVPAHDIGFAPPAPAARANEAALDDYFDRLDAAFANIATQSTPPSELPEDAVQDFQVMPRIERPVMEDELDHFDSPVTHVAPDVPTTFANPPSAIEWPVPGVVEGLTGGIRHPEPPPPEPPDQSPTITSMTTAVAAPTVVDATPPPVSQPAPALPNLPAASIPPVAPAAIADVFSALLAVEEGEPGAVPVRLVTTAQPQVTDELVEEITRRVIEQLAPGAVRDVVARVVAEIAERLVREEIARLRQRNS